MDFIGIIEVKMKMQLFIHPHVVPDMYDFILLSTNRHGQD